jgi:hypothetical protein
MVARRGAFQVTNMPRRDIPGSIEIQRKANGRLVPLINGRRWNKLEAVAECLFDNLGRGIPYKRLLDVIGRKSDNPTSRHLLRQYTSTLREMLLASNSPYHIAVIKEVGYCLCELAKNPRLSTAGVRKDHGASEMGKNVRHLRRRVPSGSAITARTVASLAVFSPSV